MTNIIETEKAVSGKSYRGHYNVGERDPFTGKPRTRNPHWLLVNKSKKDGSWRLTIGGEKVRAPGHLIAPTKD